METISINGMSCQHCVGSVKKALEAIDGITDVQVDLDTAQASFTNNGAERETIRKAIADIGFEPGE